MPVHDWTTVVSGIFHDFRLSWVCSISEVLNRGLLPPDHYALLERPSSPREPPLGTRLTDEQESEVYAHLADRIAVHNSGDRVVANIEIVSPGNKHRECEVRQFIEKLDEALFRGCHLLVIDVLPPGRHDPRGIHAAFWEHRCGHGHPVTAEQPLGLAAHRVRRVGDTTTVPRVWFETIGLGEPLPNMPLFLTPDHYVEVPLEQTYMAAWKGVPQRWKRVMEGTDTPAQPSSATDNGPKTADNA